jgi:tetratricopeptide (TPR) repeat protein
MAQCFPVLLIALALNGAAMGQQSPPANSTAPGSSSSPRRPPQAKTQAEYADYNSAYALTGGATVEKAASDFAAKYPASELRPYLYSKAMHEYQNENNPGKMLAMGDKVLALDPDNSIALVLTATVLADSLSDGDLDRQEKIAEIKKNSTRALETVDSAFVAPANATPDQIAVYKSTLQSMAHSALGIMELKTGEDAAAERDLLQAADLNKTQPDPYIWYHLALAQDHLATAMANPQQQKKKYIEAMGSVNQAVQYAVNNPDLARLAQGERDRLQQLVGNAESGRSSSGRPQETSRPPQ